MTSVKFPHASQSHPVVARRPLTHGMPVVTEWWEMMDIPGKPPLRFRDAYLAKTGLPESRFERNVFLRCVPPLRRPAAVLLLWLNPGVFARDFATLRRVADAATTQDVRDAARDLRGGALYRPSLVRDAIGVRASGRRLLLIARSVLK